MYDAYEYMEVENLFTIGNGINFMGLRFESTLQHTLSSIF